MFLYLQKDSESDPDDSIEAASHFPLFNENIKTEMIDYGLSQEIPKMETLPSLLFEETQSMVTDSQSQARTSPLSPELVFNGTPESMNIVDVSNISKADEIKMNSSQFTCGYDQDQISQNLNLEENPILGENKIKIGIESQLNVKTENADNAMEVLNDLNIPEENKQEGICEVVKNETVGSNGNSVAETDASMAENNAMDEEINIVSETGLNKLENLSGKC